MSSEDEFGVLIHPCSALWSKLIIFSLGSLAPTTPLVRVKKTSRTAESRAVAGPSKPAGKTTRGRPKNARKVLEQAESSEVLHRVVISSEHDDEDDNVLPVAHSRKGKGSNASTQSAKHVNTTAKGKGKAKADVSLQSRPSRKVAPTVESMTTDDVELVEDTEVEPLDRHIAQDLNIFGKGKKAAASTRPSKADITTKELERLRQRLKDVRAVMSPRLSIS